MRKSIERWLHKYLGYHFYTNWYEWSENKTCLKRHCKYKDLCQLPSGIAYYQLKHGKDLTGEDYDKIRNQYSD